MQTKYLDVDGAWGIVVCYDLGRFDEYEMRQDMMSFGMHGESLDHAIDVLLYEENSGMCVSRGDIRMSLVFIGRATSSPQHWDTIAHECLYHASVAIHEYYDIPFGSEDGAWLTGFLMRQAVRLLGEPCR